MDDRMILLVEDNPTKRLTLNETVPVPRWQWH